jgi:hypothetical protein
MVPIASPARAERSSAHAGPAYKMLRSEMQHALLYDPSRMVRTPAWSPRHPEVSAADVVHDSFSSKNGDACLHELLSIVGAAARGEDVQLRAQLWASVASKQYATYQVDMMETES